MNEQQLKTTIDKTPIAAMFAADLEKKGVVSVNGELYALGPVMPGDVKPTQSGWYARNYGNWRSARDWWDAHANVWRRGNDSGLVTFPSSITAQNLQWRGISVEPDAQAIADAMFEDAKRLPVRGVDVQKDRIKVGFAVPMPIDEFRDDVLLPKAVSTAKAPPDTRDNPIPQPQPVGGYYDPEGMWFDFDGVKAGKAIAWAVAAIIVVAILAAWASGAFK